MSFECEKCGSCCKIARCIYITKDNLCSIFNERPMMCRHEYSFISDEQRLVNCALFRDFVNKGCLGGE